MSTVNLLIILGVVLIGLFLIMFPKQRKELAVLLKGFTSLFVKDRLSTPDGAQMLYDQGIEEARNKYDSASATLEKLSGRLNTARQKLKEAEAKQKQTETNMENFVKQGNMQSAQLCSDQRLEAISEVNRQNQLIVELEPMVKDAQETSTFYEKKVSSLKRKQKDVVDGLRQSKELADMYKSMDSLRNNGTVDRLLESVDDSYTVSKERAVGAKAVHENKLSTKIGRMNAEAEKFQADEYLESLKTKYKK